MSRIVHQCRLPAFKYPVPDNLGDDPDDDQHRRYRPHAGDAHMIDDRRCG